MFSMSTSRALALVAVPMVMTAVFTVSVSGSASAAVSAGQVRGVNWADQRDNFVCGNLVPGGLYEDESYATVHEKATAITSQLVGLTGANTVRLPLNVDTVAGSWWNSYMAAIDAATAQGLNVILAEWDECDSRDGMLDPGWQAMWDTVIGAYGANDRVLFEIMNEPYGYSSANWLNAAAGWLNRYSSVPRGRIVVSGPGYNDNAYVVGRDNRFTGTLLSIHHYAFWQDPLTYAAWRSQTRSKVAEFADRTIFTEYGTFMTTGLDFADANAATNEIRYLRGVTDEFNALGVGSVYWPALRVGDSYSLTTISGVTQNGSGSGISLKITNASGLRRIRVGWRLADPDPGSGTPTGGTSTGAISLAGTQPKRCLDVPSSNSASGTAVSVYDCNGGANQRWTLTESGELQSLGKCLDAYGQGRSDGTAVVIYDCNGGANQQWTLTGNGTIVGVQSGLCLEARNQAGASTPVVALWTCNGGANQRWART